MEDTRLSTSSAPHKVSRKGLWKSWTLKYFRKVASKVLETPGVSLGREMWHVVPAVVRPGLPLVIDWLLLS